MKRPHHFSPSQLLTSKTTRITNKKKSRKIGRHQVKTGVELKWSEIAFWDKLNNTYRISGASINYYVPH